MKNRIFKIFLITAAMLPVGTNAFFSEVPAERLERKISVDVLTSDDVQVTISQKFKNPTEEILHGRFWFPFPENAREIQFFVDVAEWHRSARFFRLGTDEFSQLGRSSILSISSGETREFKLIFKMSATQIQDFWSLEIFADDDISDTKTEISVAIASESEIPHFFTNLPAGNALTDRSEFGTIFLSQTAGQPLFENLRIWWSKKSIPELSADGVAGKYIGHFFPRPDSAPIENVTILIDRSGSMSGEVWFRVREFVQFLFDHLGDKNFRVVFFDTEPEFFDPDFSEPTTEWQQKVLTKISNTAPVGSADSEKVFSEIFNSETPLPAHHATILISDSISGDFWKKMASDTRLILFSFQKESSPDGPLWAHRSGGFFQKLFRSATQLVESTEILQKWNHLRETIFQNAVTPLENEIEILPEKISAFSDERSPFFVGRILDPTPKFTFRPGTEFLSRAWAGRRIAQILSTEVFSEKNLDAVLSIGRMFGVETSVFGAETARDALRKNLEIVFSTPEFQLELENLAQSGGENLSVGTRFFWSVPLHPTTDGVWRSVDFFDRVDPARIVSIAPFSAAQRALWLEFPEIFADVFGVANQVEFCTHFRCFSLRYGQRAEPSPADRAFLRDFDHFVARTERKIASGAIGGSWGIFENVVFVAERKFYCGKKFAKFQRRGTGFRIFSPDRILRGQRRGSRISGRKLPSKTSTDARGGDQNFTRGRRIFSNRKIGNCYF